MNLKRLTRGPILWIVLAVAILWIAASSFMREGVERIDTSLGLELLAEEGRVEQVLIVDGQQRVDLTLTETDDEDDELGTNVQFYYVAPQGPAVVQAVVDADPPGGFNSEVPQTTWWSSLLMLLLPFVIIIALFWFLLSRMQGGGSRVMQFGKSKAKLVSKETPQVRFTDVAGVDEAVEELQEIKEFLSDPSKFQAVGAKIPKGVLLYGQPGTGKTLLARAVAGEAGVPFYSISGSDFVEMFVGVGASRVRDLFEQAKSNAPAIIFIDE
ncbi:hypothetical protein N869_07190, partial [Cellulomonas bogoriensis 69B4 = DSM 16987]